MPILFLSGLVLPGNEPGGENHVPDITITSGSAIIHFYSDAAYNMSGFNITYRQVVYSHENET